MHHSKFQAPEVNGSKEEDISVLDIYVFFVQNQDPFGPGHFGI